MSLHRVADVQLFTHLRTSMCSARATPLRIFGKTSSMRSRNSVICATVRESVRTPPEVYED